jgi:hypothetical protein
LISTLVGCTPVPTCSTDTYGVVGRGAPHLLAGSRVVLRTYMDGTELDGVATPAQCTRCDGASLGTASILSVQQLMSVLDLTGKPALRTQPAPSQSTFIADPSPNPYFTAHSVDPVWVTDSLDALTTFTTGQGADVVGEDRRTGRLDIQRGDERAWLQLTYGTTAPDAPPCLGLPNCTVVRPWAPASDGSVEVAVTETTVPPNTISMALRGPSYQVLVKRGTNLLRVDEGTTFPTLLNGQRQGYVLSWRQVASAAELLEVSGATPMPPASPS